ncbi:MAG: hypothetical protein ASARMPRED_009002 [Alectoria sarmentosa]|nr:MAG: hypothetical protein ASARMPRED_009002 [Alectoria sarmentosa]
MFVDEEEPPNLVDVTNTSVSAAATPITSQLQDVSLTKVPLTIVTGYLGSGKTTLVNYILKEQHGKKIANSVIAPHPAADVERALTVAQDGQETQEWLELANGCICCSIKDSGVNAIESLMSRRGAFDYILLETSGLADPGNLAPLFWVDDGLGSTIYLDGIVTLVDAKNILLSLDETPVEGQADEGYEGMHMTTAHLQTSHADVIIINKCDSVTPEQLEKVEQRIRGINGLAKIHRTLYSQVPKLESFLLDLHAYDGVESLDAMSMGHSHLDPTISTITLPLPPLTPGQLSSLESWLRSVLWESALPVVSQSGRESVSEATFAIHRLKGRLFTTAGAVKMIQGVREVFEIVDMDRSRSGGKGVESRDEGKLVLIGRGLGEAAFGGSLRARLKAA